MDEAVRRAPDASDPVSAVALAAVTDAVMVIDAAGVIRFVNDAFAVMSGYSPEEAIGRTSRLLAADAQDQTTHERVWPAVLSGRPWQGESVNRHRSGRLYTVDETITPVAAEDGTTTCVVVVQRDVSARQQAEQDRDLYAQLLAATGAAVIGTDLDGRVTFWNRAAERLYGWRSEEVEGRDILEVNVHPEAAAHAGWIMSQLRAGQSWTGEFEVQRRDGVRVPALVTNAPYLDAAGELAGIIGVSVSVAQLRAAEEKAQRRASQQVAVAELGRRALTDLDVDLIRDEVVRVVATELEVPLVKVLELTPDGAQLLVAAGIGWHEGVVGQALVTNERGSQAGFTLLQDRAVIVDDLATEARFRSPDLLTSHGVVSGMSAPIRGAQGDHGVLAVHTTLARTFTADEASFLEAVAGVLGAAIARERVEQQLRTVVDRLARSDEIRLAFLRATSHELRTPLSAIVGLAETLQGHDAEVDGPLRNQLLGRLTANAGRLTRLIDDLLDVDRLASGLVTANRRPQQLVELVERVVSEQDLGGRRLELSLEPVVADVDPPKLERVVANLLANAVRYTPRDATIRIALRRRDEAIELTVEDDGEGVAPGYLEQVFEPFVQGPASRHAAQPGTGLGLTLARELVALHDGTLTAGNRPGGGARFEAVLPVRPQGGEPSAPGSR